MPTKDEIEAFSRMIRQRSHEHNISLWEALIDYSEEHDIEHAVVASLLSKSLRADITLEVKDLNLLKQRGRKETVLPL
jgi:hypothetical protein